MITITYVSTKDMIADVLTKPLAQANFVMYTKKLLCQVESGQATTRRFARVGVS
jgi:hypothetical protein